MTVSNVLRLPLESVADRDAGSVVGKFTPLWFAARVLNVTAHDWWESGVPPARRRGERAVDAVAHVAASVVRHIKPPPAYRVGPTAF